MKRYLLTLESTAPDVTGLRLALRAMLRRHGLRCVDAREVVAVTGDRGAEGVAPLATSPAVSFANTNQKGAAR